MTLLRSRVVGLSVVLALIAALLAPSAAVSVPRDRDRDGLSDRKERRLKTNPRRADTDRDGLKDGRERRLKTNPRKRDTDRDGLTDGFEVAPAAAIKRSAQKRRASGRRLVQTSAVVSPTNPRRADTDGDGLKDGYEVKTSRTDPNKVDTDGDGYSDGVEVTRGWNPLDPNSPAAQDTTPPDTSITNGPASATTVTEAAFGFTATEPSSFECKVDGGAWGKCASPSAYSALPVGSHTFSVRATDTAGNVDPSPAARSWAIEAAPSVGPVAAYGFEEASGSTAVDSSGRGNNGTISGATRVTGRFGKALSFDGVNDLVNVLDSASLDLSNSMTLEAWVNPDVASNWRTVLLKENSPHLAYALYASSGGNQPVGQIYTGADSYAYGPSQLATGAWRHIVATWNGSSLKLYVDGTLVTTRSASGAIPASSGPLTIGGNGPWGEWFDGLIDEVRVYNRALTDLEILSNRLTPVVAGATPPPADTTPPDTTIDSGPSGTSTSSSASFSFSSTESGSTFECRLDSGSWGSCTSPKSYAGLSNASHTFQVRAKDAAGNVDATPASRTWTVAAPPDLTAPETTIDSGPSGTAASSAASFSFSSDEAGSTFECRLDSGSWGSCTSPKSYSGLANGTHTFEVRATDAAGNVDLTPASRSWDVAVAPDTTAPDTTIGSGPSGTVASSSASFSFSSNEAGSTFECRLDSGSWASCASPKSYAGLANGSHTFDVRATDPAGNVDASPASRTWTVNVSSGGGAAALLVTTTGNDANACTAAAPCRTFDRAYRVAAAGQIVDVGAGSYPNQVVGWDASKSGPGVVTFRPAAGATVTAQNLRVEGGAYLTFRDIDVTEAIRVYNLDPGTVRSRHVTFENMTGQTIKIVGQVSDITVRGGTFGDTVDWQPQIGKANQSDPDSSRPHDILIENATFQNYLRSGPTVHTECLQVINVDGLIVRNSRFNHCDGTGDIGITDGPSDNLLFENNFLGKAGDAYYSMQITKNVRNLVLRNNSASKAAVFSDNETGGPYTIVGNYMPFSGSLCIAGATYSRNVFAGGTCGATDLNVPAMRFVDENGFDLHLAPNSEAIGRGDAANAPGDDIDGQGRPMGGGPDAGADEAG